MADRLRVVQLNAGSLLEPNWDGRRHEVVAWLDRLEPDVVCMQEIWQSDTSANTAGWVVEQLGRGWHWTFGGGQLDARLIPDRSLLFGSAVLSRWPIDADAFHRLPVAETGPEEWFVAGAPWELLHASTAGLDVFSTHLAPAPTDGHHRVVQVRAIDDIIRGVRADQDAMVAFGQRREAMPAILCGDFNAEPESDEIRFLSSLTALGGRTTFYQDAWRVAGDGHGHTQDWRDNPIAADLNVHRKRIDYVFVGDPFRRAGDAGRVLSAQLAFDTPLTGVLASDHRGLIVEVAWPTRPLTRLEDITRSQTGLCPRESAI